jgi:peptidoglycan/xylan/chitin deacetylase (PgdA/CDA1 family)
LAGFGIRKKDVPFFLPPYEWYNDSIAKWTTAMGLTLINMSRGTLSHADYTLPGSAAYRSSQEIYDSILEFEEAAPNGLNGFILLSHIGSSPRRTDKFYLLLEDLITELKQRGYSFLRIDELLITPSP